VRPVGDRVVRSGYVTTASLRAERPRAVRRPIEAPPPSHRLRWTVIPLTALFVLGLFGGGAAHSAKPETTSVLAIHQTSYITQQSNFTVSLEVANPAGIQSVYFTFCQLSSPLCYLPVSMTLHGSNWFIGTTKNMTSYHGMIVGVKAGYNITILYNDNSTTTEPAVPNPFANLTIAQSVTGEYMFEMTVSPQVYHLTGTIHDSVTGDPVSGATVTLTPGNATPSRTSSTGVYSFSWVTNGTYTVSVVENGYRNSSATVTVAGQDSMKDIALTNDSASLTHNGDKGTGGSLLSLSGPTPWVLAAVAVGLVAVLVLLMKRKRSSAPVPPGDQAPGSP